MSLQAFGPRGSTANLSATDTASSGVQVKGDPASCYTYQFINTGNQSVYFAFGQGPGVRATIPSPGTPAPSVRVLPNEIVVYNLVPNAFFSVVCPSGQSSFLEVTPGEGM